MAPSDGARGKVAGVARRARLQGSRRSATTEVLEVARVMMAGVPGLLSGLGFDLRRLGRFLRVVTAPEGTSDEDRPKGAECQSAERTVGSEVVVDLAPVLVEDLGLQDGGDADLTLPYESLRLAPPPLTVL